MPRSLSDFKLYKASEYYYFILFYSLPVLENRRPQKYLEHWMLFVKGLYMLLQGQITKQDIIKAKELLTEFVKQTKILYSDRELSYNLHQLIHYPLIVERWGPLNHTSAFSFENFNVFLTHNTHGTKHLGQEIMNHLKIIEGIQVLKNRVQVNNEVNSSCQSSTNKLLGQIVNVELNDNELNVIESIRLDSMNLKIYSRAEINRELFTSELYKTIKTNSFTIKLILFNNLVTYGSIKFFVAVKGIVCFVLEKFIIEEKRFFGNSERLKINHIIPIIESKKLIFVTVNQIKAINHVLRVVMSEK